MSNKKVAIILPANIEKAPYVRYYTDILDEFSIPYEILCWNRNGKHSENSNIRAYNLFSPENKSLLRKSIDYYKFTRFIIKHLSSTHYDLIIIHTIVIAVFLKSIMESYINRYIFDIRDFTSFIFLFRKRLKWIIQHSAFTSISSLGFCSWLPSSTYILSHNINKQTLLAYKPHTQVFTKENIKIINIGQLRDFYSSEKLILSCKDDMRFEIIFAGIGATYNILAMNYQNRFKNIIFLGRYEKKDEISIINKVDFIYALLPSNTAEDSLVSNRFYLAVTQKIPIIVNKAGYQGKLVQDYNLGLAIDYEDDLQAQILDFKSTFNREKFEDGCNRFISLINTDYKTFEKVFINCLKNNLHVQE